MCKVHNPVGCLTVVKSHLAKHQITDFKSLKEVIEFQNTYELLRSQIIFNSQKSIEAEKIKIISDNEQLKQVIETTRILAEATLSKDLQNLKIQLEHLSSFAARSFWNKITTYRKLSALKRKVQSFEREMPAIVSWSVQDLTNTLQRNESRYLFITSQTEKAVIDNCSNELREIDKKKKVIDEVNNSIYGAIGEHKVVKELEALPDNYILINDFCLSFRPAIYNKSENDYIKSIQIDHLLVAPSGIFLIETKNWSEQSLQNLNLRSPVSQLKRTNFALYSVLNSDTENFGLNKHHWGRRKITLKNLIVLINKRPIEEFQFVKVLTLSELVSYVKYFPPVYTRKEVESLATELLWLSKH